MSPNALRKVFLSAVAALVLPVLAPTAAAEHVTKFSVGGGYPTPVEITAGPDGALWFSDRYAASIGRITTDGAITHVDVGGSTPGPFGVAAGPDGGVWYTLTLDNRVGRISPATLKTVEYDLPTPGAYPTVITAGPDGNMWFVELLAHKIGRVTPAGVVTEFATPTPNSFPKAIAAGPDGNLWFVESEGNQIGRITVDGAITEFQLPNPYSSPYRIAAGPDGAMWFTEYLGERIGRITMSGDVSEMHLAHGTWPRSLVTVPDGTMYVTVGLDSNRRIARIGRDHQMREIPVPPEPRPTPGYDFTPSKSGNLQGLAYGPDGNLWFTETDHGKIGRVDLPGRSTMNVGGVLLPR
jgi:virginiamycin B lyase